MATIEIKQCPVCMGETFTNFLKCKDYLVSGEEFLINECSRCGFKITSQVPSENSIGSYYQSENYISHSNTSTGNINRIYHIARGIMLGQKRRVVVKASGKKTGILLDIGAGTGFFVSHMKQHGWRVLGTEKSNAARSFALLEFGLDVLPTESLFGLRETSFDVVTLWHVLEHIHELGNYIEGIRRILRPDGTLFIALPNHLSFDAKHYRNFWAAYDVPRHLWHFSPSQVKMLFESSGFRLIKKHRMPLDSFYISLMSENYKKSRFAFIKGIFFGKISWIASLFNKDRSSSVIYVLKKF